ncbi:MAG: hypothetical protein KC547_16900 [Anaerolineae bacterium]|nr:hypothetical protein [Anaerolineae bacterium]
MPETRAQPLQERLDERRYAVAETLDLIEENTWELCTDIRNLRIELSRIESLREKISVM